MSILIEETNISDEYNIDWENPLGSGVNGHVCKCTEIGTEKQYAVKFLPDCPATKREIQLQASCFNCLHIVPIHKVYRNCISIQDKNGVVKEKENSLIVIMELMGGGELFDYLEGKQICEGKATKFIRQIVTALDFIHNGNIVHRDLKPENILMNDKDGELLLKLADFGYAELDDNGLTNPLYTLYYVAPEVLQHDTRFQKKSLKASSPVAYDKKCDIWSLGVIAYIMLMGYPPFSPEGSKIEMTPSMYKSILLGEFYYGEKDWQKYSSDAHDFVFSLLQVNPEDRPTAQQLLQHPWLQ